MQHDTASEAAKISEQARDFENERSLLAMKVYAEQVHEQRMSALNNIKEYGSLTIRTLYILHGGALVALLSFTAALYGKSDEKHLLIAISVARALRPAFYSFSMGLILAGIISAIAYLNYLSVHETYQSPSELSAWILGQKSDRSTDREDAIARRSLWIAVGGGLVSLGAFAVGAYFVAEALLVVGA